MASLAARAAGPERRDWFWLAAVLAVFAIAWSVTAPAPELPQADSRRYLDYTVNVLEYGTFGRSVRAEPVAPGRANMPLYPVFLALVFKVAGVDARTLQCFLHDEVRECALRPLIYARYVHLMLAALAASGIWLLGWRVGGRSIAWLALGMGLLSGQLAAYAGLLMTENITLACWAWLAVFLIDDTTCRYRTATGLGVVLGILTMTRPEFLYLACIVPIAIAASGLGDRRRLMTALKRALLVTMVVVVVCTPWAIRNAWHFGDPALTASYGAHTLAQRVQYNRMSNTELAVAFIYWLPDFGDSLARRLFPVWTYERLDFDAGSYYRDGRAYRAEVEARVGAAELVQPTIVHEAVLAHPFRHAAVTMALAWRGVFVAKLWGLAGLLAFVSVMCRQAPARRVLLGVSWPAWLMLFLYAAVSVSIPRYSIGFVPLFSLGFALLIRPLQPTPQRVVSEAVD